MNKNKISAEAIKNEIWEIDGVECRLKDLSLNELEKVEEFQKKFTQNGKLVVAKMSYAEIKEFLNLILEPIKSDKTVDYGQVKKTDISKIIGCFFLLQIVDGYSTESYWNELTQRLIEHQTG